MKPSIKTPHAAVVVWNYTHRLDGNLTEANDFVSLTPQQKIDEVDEVIVSSLSIVSITTSKFKEGSIGSFQIALAPTRNWISALTSGSWLAVMMSQSPITQDDLTKKANRKKVKLLGRIESVRMSVTVDAETGALHTSYMIHGSDWSSFLQNQVMMDAYFSSENENKFGAATTRKIIDEFYSATGERSLYAVEEQLAGLLTVLGQPITKELSEVGKAVNRVLQVRYSFSLPEKLRNFFGFRKQGQLSPDNRIVNMLELFTGKLVAPDKYEATKESQGMINFASLRGNYSMWQILQDHSNKALNEMVAEMRWGEDGPTLALYNRIKPFAISETGLPAIASKFSLLKKHLIPLGDILSIEAGTNWRDKFNMAEIRYDAASLGLQSYENGILTQNQIADVDAFQREGLRMKVEECRHYPMDAFNSDRVNVFGSLPDWTALLKEWFFNIHRQLNGSISFAGQDEYIQVGDNIQVPIQVLGVSKKLNKKALDKEQFLLLHVENIRNNFVVSSTGARSYITTIDFVRGVVVDAGGKVSVESYLDESISSISTEDRRPNNVIASGRGK